MDIASHRWFNGRWIVGGALITVGVLILMMNIGMVDRFPVWKFWPVILMIVGLNKFTQPYNRAEGFWLFSLGAWLQVSLLRLWDLGFRDTWPALLIALGIFWMWGSIERESRRRKAIPGTQTTT
jgi:hypothetical protein